MTSNYEKLSSNKAKLTFTFSAEEFDKGINAAYKKNVGKIQIRGFRKGKAPRTVIENFYGKNVFYEDAIDELFPEAFEAAVKEHGLEPVDRPENFALTQMEAGKELIFSIEVFVKPDVTLGDYKALEAKKEVAEVTDADVEAEIERARQRNARYIEITDRPAKLDDEVDIDYAGFDGERQFEGGTAKDFKLVLGSGTFIPGFEDQIVGKEIGTEFDVNVTFPEDYHEETLKGKPVVFKCKLNGIKEKEVPELNNDFAADMSFDTLDEYKADVCKNLEADAEKRAEQLFEEEIIEKACACCTIDIPNGMIETETDNLLQEIEMQLRYQYGGITLEQYCGFMGQTVEQVRENYKEQAKSRVTTQLVLEAIGKAENIVATDEDVDADIAKAAENAKKPADEYKKMIGERGVGYYKDAATNRKIVEFLKSCVK